MGKEWLGGLEGIGRLFCFSTLVECRPMTPLLFLPFLSYCLAYILFCLFVLYLLVCFFLLLFLLSFSFSFSFGLFFFLGVSLLFFPRDILDVFVCFLWGGGLVFLFFQPQLHEVLYCFFFLSISVFLSFFLFLFLIFFFCFHFLFVFVLILSFLFFCLLFISFLVFPLLLPFLCWVSIFVCSFILFLLFFCIWGLLIFSGCELVFLFFIFLTRAARRPMTPGDTHVDIMDDIVMWTLSWTLEIRRYTFFSTVQSLRTKMIRNTFIPIQQSTPLKQ